MKPLNIKVVGGLPEEELDVGVLEAHDIKIERNIKKNYIIIKLSKIYFGSYLLLLILYYLKVLFQYRD